RAERGAIVASPVLGDYDPDPDYFFHWYRDSALVVDALRLCHADGTVPSAPEHLTDFVRFSRSLTNPQRLARAAQPQWRAAVAADHQRFLRSEEELRAVDAESVAGETRVNADGHLDISRWARPQHDGPALRALALLRWVQMGAVPPESEAAIAALLRSDLAYT